MSSEEPLPYGLPPEVFAQLQPVGASGAESVPQRVSVATGGACQAPCCNQADPYWGSLTYHRDTREIELAKWRENESQHPDDIAERAWRANQAAMWAAFNATMRPGWKDTRKNIAAYFAFEKNWNNAGRIE